MNDKNLRSFGERTVSERREMAKEGGRKSGEARRQKKSMQETAQMILNMKIPPTQKTMRATMKAMGIKESDMTYKTAMLMAAVAKADSGNIQAAQFVRDTAGEAPVTNSVVSVQTDESPVRIYVPEEIPLEELETEEEAEQDVTDSE